MTQGRMLEATDTTKFQSMASALQWVISLRRFNVLTTVMMMSRFRVCPRLGHLDHLKRMYGYLRKYKHGAIRICIEIPDMSEYPDVEYAWMYSVYGDVQEFIPDDAPTPLGKEVITIAYEDANLYHDMTTGSLQQGSCTLSMACPLIGFQSIRTL